MRKTKDVKKDLPKHAVYSLTAEDVLALQTAVIEAALRAGKVITVRIYNNVTVLKGTQSAHTARNTEDVAIAADPCGDTGYIAPKVFGIDGRKNIMKWMGGVAIYDKAGHHLGAIAVSNLTAEEDKELAITAIKKCGLKTQP